jgi:outer membrane lipoprotein-sorting protein
MLRSFSQSFSTGIFPSATGTSKRPPIDWATRIGRIVARQRGIFSQSTGDDTFRICIVYFVRLFAGGGLAMIGNKHFSILGCILLAGSSAAVAADKLYQIERDPPAIAIAQTAFSAMGGTAAFARYQDSVAQGTLTIYEGGTQVSYPITMKSKGTHETRADVLMSTGTNVRIVNQTQGAMQRPDGTFMPLAMNNTIGERVSYIPLLSLLSEYQNSNISLAYQGTAQVNGQSTNVIAVSFVPYTDLAQGPVFAAVTQTIFYVDKVTGLVDKVQYTNYDESGSGSTIKIEDYLTQYQAVSGISVPFHQTTYADGNLSADLVLSSVSFNVGLPDSLFALSQ